MRRDKFHIAKSVVLALVVVALPTASAAESSPGTTHVGSLGVGGSLFWDGDYVPSARFQAQTFAYFSERLASPNRPAATDPCVTQTSPCWLYSFDVAEGAEQLEVVLDSAGKSDCYGFELIDPNGRQRAFPVGCPIARVGVGIPGVFGVGSVFSSEVFDVEAYVKDPLAGVWQAKVVVGDATDWAFRMRAALTGGEEEPEPSLLAPNLRPWLPHQFGFAAPVNPRSGTSRENLNPPGSRPVSCTWEEAVDEGAAPTRCLRFSSGLHNIGAGPLYLEFVEGDKAIQHTYYGDDTLLNYKENEEAGNYLSTDAGSGEFHDDHNHRHIEDMVLFELFQVTDPAPPPPYDPQGRNLIPIGTGAKHGFCTFENQIGEWYEFSQDPHGTIGGQVGGGCDDDLSLDRGWGDLYPWYIPGQYVDYSSIAEADGSMTPGFYLVRVTIDPENHIVETDDDDNVGWAFIRVIEDGVKGDRVVICDRGFGSSPWHPHSTSIENPFWWTIQQESQAPKSDQCMPS